MPLPILLHSSNTTATITIGITLAAVPLTTPVGSPARQSTILALQVGEFRTAEAAVSGQKLSVQAVPGQIHPIGIQRTKEWTFPQQIRSWVRPVPSGILLRVIATTAVAASTMSVTTATIGLPLLVAYTRTSCPSTTVAASGRITTAFARTASQSVVSKNNCQ